MKPVPHGEPYAGKLHVRFDEGAGVPDNKGRSALLYTLLPMSIGANLPPPVLPPNAFGNANAAGPVNATGPGGVGNAGGAAQNALAEKLSDLIKSVSMSSSMYARLMS